MARKQSHCADTRLGVPGGLEQARPEKARRNEAAACGKKNEQSKYIYIDKTE